jgi:hypothetical protein
MNMSLLNTSSIDKLIQASEAITADEQCSPSIYLHEFKTKKEYLEGRINDIKVEKEKPHEEDVRYLRAMVREYMTLQAINKDADIKDMRPELQKNLEWLHDIIQAELDTNTDVEFQKDASGFFKFLIPVIEQYRNKSYLGAHQIADLLHQPFFKKHLASTYQGAELLKENQVIQSVYEKASSQYQKTF